MTTVGGMAPTGRRYGGPASDLVEVVSEKGLKHTAIVFHPEYRAHPVFTEGLQPIVSFLERPMVTGLVDLASHHVPAGEFLYPTGTVWSVAEIVRTLADLGQTAGIKAGLELAYLASNVLLEAAETGANHGVYSHGGLTPWRLTVKADGQVQVIGYGLPQVEILTFIEDESLLPREDSFRYCPPERLEGQPEDVSSDLFGLALIAFELMTGRPVYDGLVNDIRQQAIRAEGARRLYQVRDQLTEGVREVLGRALKYDPDTRYPSAGEFVYAVHDLLSSPEAEGPSLTEVMQKVRSGPRRGKPLMGGMTGALSKEQLAAIAADLEDPDPQPLPPPRVKRPEAEPEPAPDADAGPARWGRVDRPRRSGDDAAPGRSSGEVVRPTRRPDEPMRRPEGDRPRRLEDGPRRLRRSDDGGEGGRRIRGDGPRRIRALDEPAAEEAPAGTTATEALLQRLRTSASRDEPPPPSAQAPQVRAPEPPPRAPEPPPRVPEPPRPEPIAEEIPTQPRPPARPPADPAPVVSSSVRDSGGATRARSDELVYFQIAIDGAPAQRTRLKASEPLAETANRLVQALSAPPCDLAGHCTGWYRLTQGARRWRGNQTVAALDPDLPVELAFVPNRTVLVEFEIEGLAAPIRFQSPVGTAVPVRSLLAHLQRWLNLPPGTWGLFVNEEGLGPLQILEEYEPGEGFLVVIRR